MMVQRHALFAVVLALTATACGSDNEADSSDSMAAVDTGATVPVADDTVADAPSDTEPAGVGRGLALSAADVGDIIVDDAGFTIYSFQPDLQGDSTCYDQCEATWPVVTEVADLGAGLDGSLLGTTTRTDGSVQATYNGWPLYYYANDASVGDVNGQGIGAAWYVLDAAGDPIIG